jgi:hypothetical protein
MRVLLRPDYGPKQPRRIFRIPEIPAPGTGQGGSRVIRAVIAARLHGRQDLRIEEIPDPEPGPRCQARGRPQRPGRSVMGHEFAGVGRRRRARGDRRRRPGRGAGTSAPAGRRVPTSVCTGGAISRRAPASVCTEGAISRRAPASVCTEGAISRRVRRRSAMKVQSLTRVHFLAFWSPISAHSLAIAPSVMGRLPRAPVRPPRAPVRPPRAPVRPPRAPVRPPRTPAAGPRPHRTPAAPPPCAPPDRYIRQAPAYSQGR